eukprot:1136688-Pelagomonas_calceolata.AAC.2
MSECTHVQRYEERSQVESMSEHAHIRDDEVRRQVGTSYQSARTHIRDYEVRSQVGSSSQIVRAF